MNLYESTKLFYKQYPYKLTVRTPLAKWFRGGNLKSIKLVLDQLQSQYNERKLISIVYWSRVVDISIEDLRNAKKIFIFLKKESNYKLRIESTHLSIYTEEKRSVWNLCKDIQDISLEWWEPKNTLKANEIIASSKLKGWNYRITLSNKVPEDFSKWAINNFDKIRIGPKLKDNIVNNNPYFLGFYFYVKNEKMLDLVSLILGSGISRIDKIVIEDNKA